MRDSDSGRHFLHRHFDSLFYACIVLAAIWALGGMIDNAFYNDDFLWVRAARHDMTWGNVLGYRVIGFFRPLVNVSFFLMERLVPGNLTLYNCTQILLHVTNTILLYQLFRRLLGDRFVAAATAFFFLVSFSHLGAVIWISGRTTLMASAFLLAALLVAAHPVTPRRRVAACGLFTLALASKEEAIIGTLLLPLLYWYANRNGASILQRQSEEPSPASVSSYDRPMLLGFFTLASAYLVIRTFLIGHLTQDNWAPGLHGLGNLAGSILGQFWPTLPLSLLGRSAIAHPSSSQLWPEALAIPIVAAFLAVGLVIKKPREMLFAFAWLTVCQLPTVFLKFRFLDMQSALHTRYYYLSCMGTSLAIVLVLTALWRARRFPLAAHVVAALLFLGICTNDTLRTQNFEQRFSRGNLGMRALVTDISKILEIHPDVNTLVVAEAPFEMRYLSAAVLLEEPDLVIHRSSGGIQGASQYMPCLYLGRSLQEKEQFALFVLK